MAITFDFVGNDKGLVQTFEDIQASIQRTAVALESVGKSHDIDGLTQQIESLQHAITENEKSIEASKEKLKKFAEDSKNALEIGDIKAFNDIQIDYSNELENLKDLIAGTNEYKEALEQLTNAKGLVSQTNTPLFFASEEDYKNIQEMRENIAELQAEIGNFNGSDEDLYELREALSDANDELRDAEEAASEAADALGPKLGKEAADASTKLYEINDAVEKQKKVVDDLTDQYNKAVDAVTALADSDDTAAREKALADYEMLAQQLHNAQMELTNLTNAQREAQVEWNKTSQDIDRHNSIITKLCGGEEKLNEIMDHLPAPLSKAVKGLEGMTGAAKAFIATPLGVILAGLILAWQSLSSWFERSEEGQLALAKISGYLSGVLEVLKDIAATVGEALFKAFTNPKEAIKSFGKFLISQVVNRFKAFGLIIESIGSMMKNLFTGNWSGIITSAKDLANAFGQLGTGIEKPVDKAINAIDKLHKKAKESSAIAVDEKMLEREEAKTKRLVAEYENRERTLRAKRGKRTKEEEKELKEIEKKISDAETKIIDKKIELQKRSMDNSKYDSIEEKNKLDDLYAQRERITGRANQRLAQIEVQGMTNRGKTAEKLAKERAAKEAKAFQQSLAYAEDLAKAKKEAQRAMEDAAIEAIVSQSEKERAEREIQHKRTLEDIKAKEDEIYKEIYKKRKEAYDNANKDKKYENTDEGKAGWQVLRVKTLEEVQNIEWAVITELGKSGIVNVIEEQFGGGNVNLIARPLIDAADLVAAGWKKAGEGIATVYSMQEGIKDSNGNVRQILFTPILPDGSVMTPEEMKRYLHETLEGAEDILAADSKGLVISVGEVGFDGDLGGNVLHELQAELMDFPKDKLIEIQNLYKNIDGKSFSKVENDLFKSRSNTLKAELKKEEIIWARAEQDRINQQKQSMIEYLREYGTYQQKRVALAEQYAKKIEEAEKSGNKWEVTKLSAERDTKIAQANAQSLAMNIDWNQTFSGIGNVLQDIAKETLRKVNDYMQEAEFKALGAEAKKAYLDLKQQLLDAGGQEASNPFSSKTWNEIAALTTKYQGHVKALADATEKEKKAAEAYIKVEEKKRKAEETLAQAIGKQMFAKMNGFDTTQNDIEVKEAQENLANISKELTDTFDHFNETSKEVTNQQTQANSTQQQLRQKTESAAQGLKNFNTVVDQITSGTLAGFMDGVSNVIMAITGDEDEMNGIVGLLGEKVGGIIGAILSIIDKLGEAPVEFIDGLLTGISKVVEAVISNIPQIIMSIVKGAGNIVAGIGKGILGIFGDFFGADNHEEMLELQDKYTRAIDSTTHSLEKFTEELEKSYGIMAVQNSKEAENLIRQNMNTILKGIDSALNDNYGGGHSDYWHLNKSQSVLEQILGYGSQYGVNAWNGSKLTWNELLSLNSSESLAKTFKDIRDKDSDLWRVITSELGYNEGALKEWLEKLIDTYDQIEENQKKLNEQLTTTTEENVFDDFLDSLYSLADGSEDVTEEIAKNWQQMVNKMVINNLVIEKFRGRLTEWYADLVKANDELANGGINETEYQSRIDALGESYNNILSDAQNEIDTFTEMGLIKPIEDATEEGEKAFQDMTSSWVSSLMDFNATAEDWAQNLGQTIAQKIIEEMVVPTLIQPLLDNLQAAFDKAMEENTFTESSGKKAYYWTRVLDNDGLRAAIEDINNAYPELKETIQGIMSMSGVEEGFSNSLDSLGDTLIDRLLTLDEDAEDIGKQIGSTLIREMLEQMLYSGEYAERMENIRQMWQDILTGEDTAHTADDVVKEIKQLEADMAQDTNMSTLVTQWKDLNIELGKAKEGFSDLRSTIVNSLTSAKDTVEDFGKSLGKSMMTQMLDAYIDSNYKDEITALSQEWGEALASGNTKAVEEIQQKVINLYKTIGDEDIEVKNLTDAIREIDRVLDSTFKDMTDSWVSALSSMETTAEQFAQDVGKTMAQKIISEMVAPMYIQPLLDSMQDAYNSAMDVQGASVESVINTMSPYLEQVKIVYNEIQPMVEGIFGGFGIYKEAAEEAVDEVEYRLGDLKSNFSSALMDMENSAADFSKEISKVLAQNFIEDFVLGDRFDQQMEYWKQQYESIIGSGMSEDERKRQLRALRDSIATAKEGYVNSAMAIQELLGITTEDNQEATMNMADKITYDQADQLLGINLAQELTLEQILATLQGNPTASVHGYYGANEDLQRQVEVSLNGLSNVNKAGNENMLIQLVTANSHLQLIRDYSKTIRDEVLLHLGSMDAKLSHLRTL